MISSIIDKKRNGQILSQDEIKYVINEYLNGVIIDYQMSSFLMAVYLKGMNSDELSHLTHFMMHSGKVLNLSHIKGLKIDKHSTGGVGDKVSIPLVPIVAACGLKVPMIAGRGLGHTGGTIDKLESIPGFRTNLSEKDFMHNVEFYGMCLIGQTENIAPADKKIYALRDVTQTVESIPLIASSIMSKKLASGMDGLVLDVKTGCGAFMKDYGQAVELATTMIAIGKKMGKRMQAIITNMNQPLGYAIGNSIEIEESIDILKGNGPKDVTEITIVFAAYMLKMGEICSTYEEGRLLAQKAIKSGAALRKFEEFVSNQGGNPNIINNYQLLPHAALSKFALSAEFGYVSKIDTLMLGNIAILLGAGRENKESVLDLAVGFRLYVKVGDYIVCNQVIAEVYCNDRTKLQQATTNIQSCISYVPDPTLIDKSYLQLIYQVIES